MPVPAEFKTKILTLTQAKAITHDELIQPLWSGYGELLRLKLEAGNRQSVVVKYIKLRADTTHPKGWNTQTSFLRKQHSYDVECYWYQHYSQYHQLDTTAKPDALAKVPECLFLEQTDNDLLLVIEDLQHHYPLVTDSATNTQVQAVLTWLALFHAQYMQQPTKGLWPQGGYWHLDTRPDELAALDDPQLISAARHFDSQLKSGVYQTLIHGDAKLANFCFSKDGAQVAAVDFQYVGQGCGIKDVMLFISSCIPPEQCQQQQETLLDYYFVQLRRALKGKTQIDSQALEDEWRKLYCIAWADFYRFVKGWSPGHWKINAYSNSLYQQALGLIENS